MAEQKLKKLPLGISTFSEIIQENYVYVDKTKLIYELVTSGKYYFISRPRRFGKSLLVSTLAELFSGNRELFKNLWIHSSDYDWQKYPVIRFDFSTIGHRTAAELISNINTHLNVVARENNINLIDFASIDSKFQELIFQLSKINKVGILIDEYDKPILDHIDNMPEAKAQREVLKSLYAIIKGADQYVKFVLLTGVTKFAKTSIFSGINNLRDITLSKEYATLLGYTEQELLNNFMPHLCAQIPAIANDVADVVTFFKKQYNGYRFAQNGEPVFNPYSVLTALTESELENYWFETGTPTFLVDLLKHGCYPLDCIYQPIMSAHELGSFEPEKIKISALLYQTGYLSIVSYDRHAKMYTLDFPNHEVASAFNLLISTAFTQLTENQTKTHATIIAQACMQHDIFALQNALQNFFNQMPYNVCIKREYDLHIIVFSIFKIIGIEVDPEVATRLGRADLVVSLPQLIYVIELKFNKTAHEALEQIKDKKYYEKYENTDKQITLLGINFDEPTKTVSLESSVV